ncbi:unnamed protein product [Effrenium voratum]|uniref:Uncharacterized protein n=1 Tax=Effrenium voratum TaxID=2562239 RepID=A0AA36IBX0_9DINO|nr:unnamed protein product [Effrenium voratum]CAJ1397762.1 unnamed protein product [Effrenium voratum]CAJ1407651.1 unnamed protein product [Effrenium voratum]CAJ1413663.1 unnamed protein product [Effrenium voratum]CAJ1414901.1 unnamed protein product [Effrenium voratum]
MAGKVEITRAVALTFDGTTQAIPAELLRDFDGTTFLKLRGSKPEIAKLVCGSSCRLPKNASLANGAKMQELKAKRLAAWQNVCLEEAEQEEDNIFGGGDCNPTETNAPSKKRQREDCVVTVDIFGTDVKVFCPGKRMQQNDVQVALDESQLSAVFQFLKADCPAAPSSKRQYKKSGRYSALSKEDEEDEECE